MQTHTFLIANISTPSRPMQGNKAVKPHPKAPQDCQIHSKIIMEGHTAFHPFPQLPTELRLRVWHLVSPKPSSVTSSRFNTTRHEEWTSGTKALSIIHPCPKSRFEYLDSSSALGPPCSGSHPKYMISRFAPNLREVFFSFEHDTLIMLA